MHRGVYLSKQNPLFFVSYLMIMGLGFCSLGCEQEIVIQGHSLSLIPSL